MACPTIQLSDSSGELWGLTIPDVGPPLESTDLLKTGAPNQVVLLCDLQRENIFSIGVDTAGMVIYTLVGPLQLPALQYAGAYPNFLRISSTKYQWVIAVTLNQDNQPMVEAVQVGPAGATDPVLGQIYKPDEPYVATYAQPGGIGTPTFPQETIGEMQATFVVGCGHFVNNPEVVFTSIGCQQAALVVCPVCRFVSRIISPSSLLYGFGNEIVFP